MITSRLGINYYLRHLVIGQKNNFLGGNWKGFAASNCNDFPSLISPFISGRESQNESFPRTHSLGERTRQVWQDNNRRVRTHESDSRIAARRLGRIIQGIFFCPIRSRYSRSRLEMVRWDLVPRGSSARSWKLSSRHFARPRLTAPGSPRMGFLLQMKQNAKI